MWSVFSKGRTIRKVKGGVGQNQKKNLSPAKNEKKKNLSRHSAKKKIAFLEDTELPSLTVTQKGKKAARFGVQIKEGVPIFGYFWQIIVPENSGKFANNNLVKKKKSFQPSSEKKKDFFYRCTKKKLIAA